MADLGLMCRTLTTFKANQELDEDAFRLFLQRMVDSRVGVCLASAGSGQGWTLTHDELRRVYAIGVDVCKGKVPVSANLPEQPTARWTIEQAKIAIASGVDEINVYGPAPVHGYRSNDAETLAYYVEVLSEIKHPVSIAPNIMVPTPSPALLAEVANRFPQVRAVMLTDQDDGYYIALRDALKRDVTINVSFGLVHALLLGANGVITSQANIMPKAFRLYCDLFDKRDFAGLAKVYRDIERFATYVRQFRAWHKVALKAFKLPGGEGGVRPPYILPTDEEIERFVAGLPALHIPEIDELSRAAGVAAS